MTETATPETVNHYLKPEVQKVIIDIADNGTSTRAGNGDFVKWGNIKQTGLKLHMVSTAGLAAVG